MLGGHFQLAGPQAEMLLGMLPPVVHQQSETDRETLRWAFDRMRQELTDLKPVPTKNSEGREKSGVLGRVAVVSPACLRS